MPWCVGIDEAGYGPNLGPLVQAAVAVRLPDEDHSGWETLRPFARRVHEAEDGCLVIDDSKKVYAGPNGFDKLAAGVCGWFGESWPECVHWLAGRASDGLVPPSLARPANKPDSHVAVNYVHPASFNAVVAKSGTKAAVLADGLIGLLRAMHERLPDSEPVIVHADKQGGRHYYATFLQEAFSDGWVIAEVEGPLESRYRVLELGREVVVRFTPRADGASAAVAVASMVCKYLREVGMKQFNAFWETHVPGLKPTAGYPGDAARYYAAIRETMAKLKIEEATVWRVK